MLKSTKNGLASRVLGADQIPNKNILVTSDSIVMTEDRPASATSAGVVSTGAQSFAGDKTFTGQATFTGGTVGVTATATNTEINVVAFPSSVGSGGGIWSETGTVFDSGLSTTSTAGDLPLAGVTSTAIKMVANASSTEATNYVSTTLTMPATLLNRKLKVDIWMRPGTGFASSEWTVSVYSGSTRMSLSTDSSGVTYLPNATGKFTTTFDADNSSTYTLRFARVSGTGSATLNVCNVIVGPGIQPQGAVVGDWTSFSPTFGFTASASSGYYRRVGSSMEVYCTATYSSGATITLTVPNSLNINTNISGTDYELGTVSVLDASNVYKSYNGSVKQTSVTTVGARGNDAAATGSDNWTSSNPLALAAGDLFKFHFTVPIAEWASSGTCNVAQNDVEYASNDGSGGVTANATFDTGMVYGPNGSAFVGVVSTTAGTLTKYKVRFQSAVQVTDQLIIEVNQGNGWVPVQDSLGGFCCINQADSFYGMYITRTTTATDIYVNFGNKGRIPSASNGAAYAANGEAWNAVTAYRWRVRKTSAGAAVGFGLATTESAGLVNPYTVGSGVVYSGTYIPSIVNVTGVTVNTTQAAQYMRVGKTVHVTGKTSLTFADSTDRVCTITIPVARPSNFGASGGCAGVGVANRGGGSYSNFGANISGTNGAQTVTFETSGGKADVDNNPHDVTFSFMYTLE